MPAALPPHPGGLERIWRALLQAPTCELLRRAADCEKVTVHLVGGALRDAALQIEPRDFDVVTGGGGQRLAERLATELTTRPVALGGDRFAAFRLGTPYGQIDIWDRGSMSLAEDLHRRDFTIHSCALDLESAELIDPCAGLEDLAARRLRMTTLQAFTEDPLRIMRLCRFAARLPDFTVDPATLREAARAHHRLTGVAAERIRMELELTLDCERTAIGVDLWLGLDILPGVLLGRPADRVTTRALQRIAAQMYARLAKGIRDLKLPVDRPLSHLALFLLVLHRQRQLDIDDARHQLLEGGLITRATSRRLASLAAAATVPTTTAAQRWWLHRLDRLWGSALAQAYALAGLDESPPQAIDRVRSAAALAVRSAGEIFTPPWLLTGDDLKEHLGLESGARLGRVLEQVRRRQIEGIIADRQQALELATDVAARLPGT